LDGYGSLESVSYVVEVPRGDIDSRQSCHGRHDFGQGPTGMPVAAVLDFLKTM